MHFIFTKLENGENQTKEDMKESSKRNKIMLTSRHKWIQIGNGYSKCSVCGIVKYHKTKTSAATYTMNNIPVENAGCINKKDIETKEECQHEFIS